MRCSNMMITSRDPQLFQQQLQASQKSVADTRLADAHEGYYRDLLGSKERMTQRLDRREITPSRRARTFGGAGSQRSKGVSTVNTPPIAATDRAGIAADAKRDALNTKIDGELAA
jgi:hypothetical protein